MVQRYVEYFEPPNFSRTFSKTFFKPSFRTGTGVTLRRIRFKTSKNCFRDCGCKGRHNFQTRKHFPTFFIIFLKKTSFRPFIPFIYKSTTIPLSPLHCGKGPHGIRIRSIMTPQHGPTGKRIEAASPGITGKTIFRPDIEHTNFSRTAPAALRLNARNVIFV